jgi:predicted nucleic acid-binding protein
MIIPPNGCAPLRVWISVPILPAFQLLLSNLLDPGEAAVIHTAQQEGIATVILDEIKARRVARLAGLEVTGSIGVLLHAKRMGRLASVTEAIDCLKARGTWLIRTW